MDAADPSSLVLKLDAPAVETGQTLTFNLGIDSATNVAGALGGDLDPTRGMYWAWQSGYVNFKLEGTSPRCPTRKHVFQFHIGGFLAPHNALQTVTLPLPKGSENDLTVQFDVQQFLSNIDLTTQNSLMIPSDASVVLAHKAAQIFRIQ